MSKNAKVSFTRPGEVSIDKINLISSKGKAVNALAQCIGIDLYEDMFSPFISGILYMKDSQDLVNKLPLVGEETLELEFSTPQLGKKVKYAGKYFISKMEDRTKTTEREVIYALHFVSQEAYTDLNRKVSRAYSGYIHDIIKEIVTGEHGLESKKNLNYEEAVNRTKFISNFWSPIKNIQYACENATNATNSPSFIFFENKNGFNFVTLDTLYGKEKIDHSFKWDNYTAEVSKTGGSRKSLREDYKRVLDFQSFPGFDYIKRVKSGAYGSEIIYYDLTTGQYVHNYYLPKWEDGKHLNKEPLWSSTTATPKSNLIYGKQAYNNFQDYTAETANTKVEQRRQALLAQAETYKCTITVFGNPDINAGQKVYLEVPVATQITTSDESIIDKIQSGNYLVGAVCHRITRKEYYCTIELIKESHMAGVYE